MNHRHGIIYTIFALLLLATGLQAQTSKNMDIDIDWGIFARDSVMPYYRCSVPLDEEYSCFSYKAVIEYPEFIPLTQKELKKYRPDNLPDTLPAWPQIETSVGVSAKKGVLDIGFTPIVFLDGRYQRINSFKLVIERMVDGKALARKMSAPATRALTRYADSSVLATGKWVKIRVKTNGVYRITKSELAKMGFNDPSKVRLFGRGGEIMPETGIGNIADDLQEVPLWRNNGNLLFYANGTTKWKFSSNEFTHEQNHYSQYSYYFLNQTDGKEPMTFPVAESPSTTTTQTTFPDYALHEKDEFSLCTFGRTLLENDDYSSGRTKSYNITLTDIASPRIRIGVSFGSNALSENNVGVYLNNSALGSLAVGKASSVEKGKIAEGTFSGNCTGEKATITLKHNVTSNSTNGFLDYIRITYTRKLSMHGPALCFRGSFSKGNAIFKIATDRPDIKVWNISAGTATQYKGEYADGHYSVAAPASGNDTYVAVDINGSHPSVEIVGSIDNQNLHALGQTDMVIIVPSNRQFIGQAERLAEMHRNKDNMKVAVVTADQIYNEFSSGTPDATAYRRFMKMFYDRAEGSEDAPKHLLLMGDAFSDNRLITYKNRRQEDYLLCYPSKNSVSTTESYVLEDYFGFLDDGEGSNHTSDKVDIGIGRIPAQTLSGVTAVVDKIIAYAENKEAGPWQNNIVLLADDGDEHNPNSHMRDAENIASVVQKNYPSFMLRRIYWDDYPMVKLATGNSYPAVNAAINEQLQEGALIMNYSGHGSANLFSHEMAWKASDMTASTSTRLPLWVTASCDISPFDIGDGSIGEEAIMNPKGGAIAMFTTTRTVYQAHNSLLNREFMKLILSRNAEGRRIAIGDAVRQSKVNLIYGASDMSTNKLQYILLGDPALKLNLPEYRAVVDSFDGATAETTGKASAGGRISIEGHIENHVGVLATEFNGIISPTMFDYEEEITTRDNTGLGTYTYYAHKSKLYSGSDSVVAGKFKITIPVPMDISYSDSEGLLNLYAVTHDRNLAAQGRYNNFIVGGTSPDIADDRKGPEISMWLNSPDFRDGDNVNSSPCLFVSLKDINGINTIGSGIGHDIVAIVDNKAEYTLNLNSAFAVSVGDYTSGKIAVPLPDLPEGEHTVMVRAWDLLNNSSTAFIRFNVVPGLAPEFLELTATPNPVRRGESTTFRLKHNRPQSEITVTLELLNFQGQLLWSNTENAVCDGTEYTYTWNVAAAGGQPIPTGVYLYRAKISAGGSTEQTKTGKIIILNNK